MPPRKPKSKEVVPATKTPKHIEGEIVDDSLVLRDLIDVERARIESADKRTELFREVIKANDESDKRQYDVQIKRITEESDRGQRQHSLATTIFAWCGGFVALVLLALLALVFLGDERQSDMAMEILKVSFTGLGGGGLLFLVMRAIRWALNRR